MRACMIFLGKELREHMRSYRLPVLAAVFVIFGMMSPATARYMPELLKAFGNGIVLNLPPVSFTDSYLQFFKNLSSMGDIILLLVFAGMVAAEKSKGSAPLILTKSLSRASFVLAKYMGAALVWTAIYLAGALVCQGYTIWLFPGSHADNLLAAFAAYWLYGLMLLALTVLASAVAKSQGMAALGAFAGWGLLLVSMIPSGAAKVSPAALSSMNLQVILGSMPAGDLLIPALVAVGVIGVSLGAAVYSMMKQEM